jgi:hypothetical protein
MLTQLKSRTKLEMLLSSPIAVEIEEFCRTWIPEIYGIQTDEYKYRKACIAELLELTDGIVSEKTIQKRWNWWSEKSSPAYHVPNYVKPILRLAHQKYVALKGYEILPRKDVDEIYQKYSRTDLPQ